MFNSKIHRGDSYHHARSQEKFEFSLPFVLKNDSSCCEKSSNLLKKVLADNIGFSVSRTVLFGQEKKSSQLLAW
jgi:hypothetical protein